MYAVFGRCHACATLEIAVEMLAALEAESVCHFRNGVIGGVQIFLGDVDNLLLDELHRRFPCLFLHEVAEVVGRQAALISKYLDRRQSAHEN